MVEVHLLALFERNFFHAAVVGIERNDGGPGQLPGKLFGQLGLPGAGRTGDADDVRSHSRGRGSHPSVQPEDGFHKAIDGEDARLGRDLDAERAGGARGDRADGDHLDAGAAFPRPAAATKFCDRGGTGEGDAIGLGGGVEDFAGAAGRPRPEPPCGRLPPRPHGRRGGPVRRAPGRGPRRRAAAERAFPARSCGAKASSRPSATYSLPIRSTFRCSASMAARVAGPMAQMLRPQRAQIGGGAVQALQEEAHAVGAGEDQPVVGGEVGDGAVERGVIGGGTDLDGGHLDGLGAQRVAGARRERRPGLWRASPRCACRTAAGARTSSACRAGAPPRPR